MIKYNHQILIKDVKKNVCNTNIFLYKKLIILFGLFFIIFHFFECHSIIGQVEKNEMKNFKCERLDKDKNNNTLLGNNSYIDIDNLIPHFENDMNFGNITTDIKAIAF